MTARLVVATWNAPPRLGPHGDGMRAIAKAGADVIACQELADSDPARICPPGFAWHRPKRARSTAVFWRTATCRPKRKGARRLSSPGFRSLRYGVWVDLATPAGRLRVMSVHLPAFYNKTPANRAEYDRQVRLVAEWVHRQGRRVVAGDMNGSKGGTRLAPLVEVTRISKPVPSGPGGQAIDYVAASRAGRWRPVDTRTLPYMGSDHRPVLVTLAR